MNKILLFLLPLALLADSNVQSCNAAIINKSRTHPVTTKEIKKEIENNLNIIDKCHKYPDIVEEAKLYNEYLEFKYLKLPTVFVNENELIKRCRRLEQ